MLKKTKEKPKTFRRELLALSMVHQLGVQRIRILLQDSYHPKEIFDMDAERLEEINGIGPTVANTISSFDKWDEVDQIIERSQKIGAQIITWFDENYPQLLREIYDPPILFWLKGNAEALKAEAVSIIGTRRATDYGKEQAKYFTEKLVEQNLTIVSGLAYGIDGVAHKTTLENGGKTVAVLGSGIDNIYPWKHAGLAKKIIENDGAVLSEFPLGSAPDAGNFPERNRIVSGLTMGTLIVESGLKGGSMITAQSALMQNREVFVVPHSLDNVNGNGCNHLIKRGAGKLIQTVDDILDELPLHQQKELELSDSKQKNNHWKKLALDDISISICELLENSPKHIDAISEEIGLASHQLSAKLLELEMQQCVRQKTGKNFELR